ncbi:MULTISPECIES: aminotransferase class IV [Sphingobacterium]|uniref:aminotransferase class IV n=1 Tax=Sphingobacterium TaxID=28453 RepID=UPI00104FDFD5|nr:MULTISPECIES: aminotransferase class IV [Sphingobacterium]MCW2259346.1 D-alanine transaminase/branched-chain amino acid aminotransferase [Sphingobacterium kitahiroshimense]TCR14206.1 D-alanine transaminase/branched-chain amino acid aminotransferase [Sphingobacterium sp. JUb78]
MQTLYVIFNGKLIPENEAKLSITDLAIVRGYGIFDFFKTVNGIPIFLEDNLDRFFQSANLMDLPVNYSRDELRAQIITLMEANVIPDSGIKILLTGGYSSDGYSIAEPNLIISQQALKRNLVLESTGLKLLAFHYHRPFSLVKSIDYVMGIQALKAAKSQGADDVVYIQNGLISECPRANFFLISEDGKLLTAGDDVLQGITRKKIIQLAKTIMDVEVRNISVEEIASASEAFISSTTKNITPVTTLLGYKEFGKQVGPLTMRLQELLQELVYNPS